MSGKNLQPKHLQTDVSMATSLTSNPVPIMYEDSVAIQLNFTGAPVGTFQVQGSLDYDPGGPLGTLANAGNWANVTLSPVPTAAGAPDVILIDMYALSFPYLRVVYTRTSGTGVLNTYVDCKKLGS